MALETPLWLLMAEPAGGLVASPRSCVSGVLGDFAGTRELLLNKCVLKGREFAVVAEGGSRLSL